MSAAPSRWHQKISSDLMRQLTAFFHGKPCKVYAAPFDVRMPLTKESEVTTVVQPDISVICDPDKLDDNGCLGAPDLVVEILSPWTGQKDVKEKFLLYESRGVKEYWIVHPHENYIEVYSLKERIYGRRTVYTSKDILTTKLFKGLEVYLNLFFGEEETAEKKTPSPGGKGSGK